MAAEAIASQGQIRILAGGHHHMHLGRQVIEQKGESGVDRWGIKNVIVIQHQDKGVRDRGEFIEQARQH
ncbi:MAG: hypothetical protein R2867_39450 [Caldilineaceae bacterium]